MRQIFTISLLVIGLLMSCNNARYITVKHVKPVNHHRFYNRKKDKGKKRVKYVKVKILKKSPTVKPPHEKPPKVKKEKETEENIAPDQIQNEADSTGLLY